MKTEVQKLTLYIGDLTVAMKTGLSEEMPRKNLIKYLKISPRTTTKMILILAKDKCADLILRSGANYL